MNFPNLPYLIDGDFKMSESSAIPRYIINKSDKKDLLGKNIQDQARVDEILGVIEDARKPVSPLFWDKEWESKKADAWQKALPKFELLNKFIGEKDYLLGYLTLADFKIAEASYYFEKLYTEHADEFKKLIGIRSRV